MGIAIRRLDGPSKGQVYVERDDLAEAMLATGQAERATFGQVNVAVPPPVETPELAKKMSRAELEVEVERRGVSVSGSGKDGAVLKRDLIDALS